MRESFLFGVEEVFEVKGDVSIASKLGIILDNQPLFSRDVSVNIALVKCWNSKMRMRAIDIMP